MLRSQCRTSDPWSDVEQAKSPSRSRKVGGKTEPFPAVTMCSLGVAGGKERHLVSSQDCFSLVPVLGQSGSRCRVSEPLRESTHKDEAGRPSTPKALHSFLNIVLEVAGDRDSGGDHHLFHPSSSAKPLISTG